MTKVWRSPSIFLNLLVFLVYGTVSLGWVMHAWKKLFGGSIFPVGARAAKFQADVRKASIRA